MPNTRTITQCTCRKCGHKWWPVRPGKPRACAKCKQTGWESNSHERGKPIVNFPVEKLDNED